MGREVSSKVLDGINDLVIMAPIKEGFINAYEPATFATRLRIICEALNDIRGAAREYEKISPFSDASERILSLLEFKAGIIDNDLLQLQPGLGLTATRYFYLIATFDGVWEPYMRLIWRPLGPLLDLLFSNCEGYVFACDNSFTDYLNWVRSAQVESSVFFTTTGVTVSDQLYLRNIEKLHRESAGNVDLAATRMALKNPGDVAAEVRKTPPMGPPIGPRIANKLALEALGVFYRLADYYPSLDQSYLGQLPGSPKSEGYLLQRAVHSVLSGWDYEGLHGLLNLPDGTALLPEQQVQKMALSRFKPLVNWFWDGATTFNTGAFPSAMPKTPDPVLKAGEVQRGILRAPKIEGAKQRHGAVLLMTVTDPQGGARFVQTLLDNGEIQFEPEEGGTAEVPADGIFRTIGFTRTGLERLAMARETVDAFPKEFREGLHVRGPYFGETWDNHPRSWPLAERNWPAMREGERPRPPVEMEEVDLALTLRHLSIDDDQGDAVRADMERLASLAAEHCVMLQSFDLLENQFDENGELSDHFGLRDGLSQPRPHSGAETDPNKRIGEKRDDAPLGDVLCGYATDREDFAPLDNEKVIGTSENKKLDDSKRSRKAARILQLNGSYLVIRKMSQNVPAYQKFKADSAAKLELPEDLIAAKLLGRYPNGTPLVPPHSDQQNDFDYKNDAAGSLCPFASHIRRSNPRVVEHDRPSPRLVRRGMSYGPVYSEATKDAPRGLMFMAYNASISEQYETIQRWINGGNSTGVASSNNCPLTGTPPRPDGKRVYRFEHENKVHRADIPTPFVGLEWGLYLFVPSRTTLAELAKTNRRYQPLDELYEMRGGEFIDRMESLPNDIAALEWKRILEDFDTKDYSQRDTTPDVYSAIRSWRGGVVQVGGGLTKADAYKISGANSYGEGRVFVVGSRSKIIDVLSNHKHYSVEEELQRLITTSGSIYVAQQPDGNYEDPKLKQFDYWAESAETNAIINGYGYEDGYDHGYKAGRAVLDWLIKDAEDRHAALGLPGKADFKMELNREYISPALSWLNRYWFGLPDGGFKEVDPFEAGNPGYADTGAGAKASFMAPGDWDWRPTSKREAICPGDCLSPSRHAFYPGSNDISEALAKDHGKAIKEAGEKFAAYYFDVAGIEKTPGIIARRVFALKGMTKELAARNVIGIMLGSTPPTLGNLRGIFYDWLNERTLWRNQAALREAAGGKHADYGAAKEALLRPLSVSMCKRPSPELLYRECLGDKDGNPVVIERKVRRQGLPTIRENLTVNKGDMVILPLVSGTQQALFDEGRDPGGGALEKGVTLVFGGERTFDGTKEKPNSPVHACPGRKLAMGAMMGVVAALLDIGRIQAQPAGLIIKISDWD